MAASLRHFGLPWSRSTVASVERGTKAIDLGEFVLLCQSFPISELLATDGWIQLPGTVAMKSEAVLLFLAGRGTKVTLDQLDNPPLEQAARAALDKITGVIRRASELTGLDSVGDVARAVDGLDLDTLDPESLRSFSQPGLAEQKAAEKLTKKLDLDVEVIDVVRESLKLWGRPMTAERDRRVAERPDVESRRSVQAYRGQVTRQLLTEITPHLTKQRKRRKH